VQHDRLRRKCLASKRVQRRILVTALKRQGVPDVRNDKLLPRVLRQRLIKQGITSFEAGVTLGEIFQASRTHRNLDSLRIEAVRRLAQLKAGMANAPSAPDRRPTSV